MAAVNGTDGRRQQQTSHMLKTGRRGNPFCKDTHDLFATLVVSLDLSDRTRFFRTYPNSFTTDDAAANLASLRFSQSNRTSDPNDSQRIVTTTTTTTFSMSREIAKGICQHFMDARLIENATDTSITTFKDRGIFQITPKGLHVLERFITKNGISADHLVGVFNTQPICMTLLHLERRQADDEIHFNRSVIDVVFRRFSGGRHPNYVAEPHSGRSSPTVYRPFLDNVRPSSTFDRSAGVELQDVTDKSKSGSLTIVKQVFNSIGAIDWLVDYSTCCCREEAGELMAHFVRYGLVELHIDRSKMGDRVSAAEVRGRSHDGEAEYRHGPRVLYRITDEGRKTAMGGEAVASAVPKKVASAAEVKLASSVDGSVDDDASSARSVEGTKPTDRSFAGGQGTSNVTDAQLSRKQSVADLFKDTGSDTSTPNPFSRDQHHSTTTRLRAVLDEPALRSIFRDFLRANYCDENLGFWIDVTDFRRRFSTTSSAVGGANPATTKKKNGSVTNAMETHQQHLVTAALNIYNTYLAPLSPNELNIDHNLRADVVNYVNRSLGDVSSKGGLEDQEPPTLRATQVQTLLRQYERIQEHIFRLLATDQLPRFVRTEPFLRLMDANTQDSFSNTTSLDLSRNASTSNLSGTTSLSRNGTVGGKASSTT